MKKVHAMALASLLRIDELKESLLSIEDVLITTEDFEEADLLLKVANATDRKIELTYQQLYN